LAGWSKTQLHVYQGIRLVFPKRYQAARQVFWCESSYNPWARNPYSGALGVPQFLPSWVPYFHDRGLNITGGHWFEQLMAAHVLFRASHFTWRQWSCQPR
jgi:hypothetical protein